MTTFSNDDETLLRRAGWYPGRRIDTSRYKSHADEAKLPYHIKSDEFLREFGDVWLVLPTFHKQLEHNNINFDPIEALGDSSWAENILLSCQQLGKPLALVGTINGEINILIDEQEIMYGDDSSGIYYIGEGIYKGVARLLKGGNLERMSSSAWH